MNEFKKFLMERYKNQQKEQGKTECEQLAKIDFHFIDELEDIGFTTNMVFEIGKPNFLLVIKKKEI